MFNRFSVKIAAVSALLDMGATALALHIAASVRPAILSLPWLQPIDTAIVPLSIHAGATLLWALTFLIGSVYDPKRTYKVVDELQNVSLSSGLAALAFAGLLFFLMRDFSRYLFLTFLIINFGFHISWRLIVRLLGKIYLPPTTQRRVLIVGAGEFSQQVSDMLSEHSWMGLHLVGYLSDNTLSQLNGRPVLGRIEAVRQVVEQERINDVVIALPRPSHERINQMVIDLQNLLIEVHVVPDYYSLSLYRASVNDFGGLPMISLRDPALNEVERLVKRLFDLVVGSILLVVALPLMALTALVVRLDSPGPVLFRQKRIGENGRPFTIYKFRSMIEGAAKLQDQVNEINENGNLIHKKAGDPRVTGVGRFLRRFSLDELPQLFNVLQGDMSLVGPRPELPWLVEEYEPWQRKRLAVPQGITGWWQVNGRADKPLHLHSEDDLYYIQNYSLWLDIYILIKTVWVALRGGGAY